MTAALHLLIIEDVEADFLLVRHHLQQQGRPALCRWVADGDQLAVALTEGGWDAVLCDYNVPGLDFKKCLTMIQARFPNLPVILLSGSVGEETAVDLLKYGVWDFILKDNLLRLIPAIDRCLGEAAARRARREAERAQRFSLHLLEILHRHTAISPLLKEFVREIRAYTGCDGVGIRVLDDEGNIPYQAYEGFSRQFFEAESPLSVKSDQCMCINVIKGTADPALPFYSEGGSFYINATSRFLATVSEEEKGKTRNVCNATGYESVALVPFRSNGRILGLIHVADRRENMVPLPMVKLLEQAALQLGTAFQRARAEAQLQQQEERFRRLSQEFQALLDNVPDGIVLFGPDLTVRWANRTLLDHVGGPAGVAEVTNKICHAAFWNYPAPCPQCPVVRSFASGRFESGNIVTPTGKILELRAAPIMGESGQVESVIEILRDITEHRKLEEQLRQAQKMESIGTLAGGIAHDFNNILTAVLGYADMVLEGLAPGSRNWKLQQEVINAGLRAKELVKQILTFSRQTEHDFKPLQLHLIIKETLKLLRASIPTTIEIRQDIDASCGAVLADPTQIHQVLLNLCTNSYHAMREKGGVLEVCLRETVIGQDDHIANLELTPGKYAKLSVSDTGAGIRLEDMEKIFEPYFTTKPVDEGTGLGLSVAHGIVKSHKGRISVYSEPGKGTVFNLYFPCIAAAGETGEARSDELLPGGNERILVVDDEEFIVRIEQFILENLGYRITATTSSKEALRIFAQQPADFDLVITDMTMPHLTGADLARKFLAIRPDIPLILCTGFNAQINEETAKEIGIREFALKPVSKRDLAYMVRRALDDAQQGWQKTAGSA
jgi:signal transduction histidine kinase/DNA-binding response OmpR family regulator